MNGPVSSALITFTGTLLDRLTHHVHIPAMSGDSFRLNKQPNVQTPQK
jgi:hypothetical protein